MTDLELIAGIGLAIAFTFIYVATRTPLDK
jgi:hypothetical protein